MSKALVTIGSMTNHGGIVSECDTTFIINGIAVHLNGMKHFCPKCKTVVSAIASDQTTIVNGRAVVLAGDKTTCGATFLANQHLVVAQPKSSSSPSPAMSKLQNTQSPIAKAASSLPNMTMGLTDQSNQPKGPFTGSGRGDPDTTRGVLNDLTFGMSEKVLTALGIEPADPKKLEQGETVGAVIGLGKIKIAAKAVKKGAETALSKIVTKGDKWARTPSSLQDELTLKAAKSGQGQKIMSNMGDPKYKGWDKYEYKTKSNEGFDSVVHYVKDPKTGQVADFKFKKRTSDSVSSVDKAKPKPKSIKD